MRNNYKEHEHSVERAKGRLTKRFSEKAVKIVKLRAIPDLILVDFENQQITAVEVSRGNQKRLKRKKYQHSDFDRILYMKVRPKKHKMKLFEESV